MFWVELAIYLVIITSLIYYSQFFLWIIFALFAYRFWSLILPYDTMSKWIDFEHHFHYTLIIIVITAITYFVVMWTTQSLPIIKYVFLLVMAVYTLRTYSISDVMFFKDYLEAKGMWSTDYWVEAFKNIFHFSQNPDGILELFKNIGQKIMDVISAFGNYIKSL